MKRFVWLLIACLGVLVSCAQVEAPIAVSAPLIVPGGGALYLTDTVKLSCSTDGASIYYSTDGTEPSIDYIAPIALPLGRYVVKAIAEKESVRSSVSSASFIISDIPQEEVEEPETVELEHVSTPVISPSGGSLTTANSISLSCATDAATVVYTLDGTDPTSKSRKYTTVILPSVGTFTIKALAFKYGMGDSPIVSASFVVSAPAPEALPTLVSPVIIPSGGKIYIGDTIAITHSTAGVSIAYTLDGSEPTVSSTLYTAPIATSEGTLVVKALAFKIGYTNSSVVASAFTVSSPVNAWIYNSKWKLIKAVATVKSKDVINIDTLQAEIDAYNETHTDDQYFLEDSPTPVENAPNAHIWIVKPLTFERIQEFVDVDRSLVDGRYDAWNRDAIAAAGILYIDNEPPPYAPLPDPPVDARPDYEKYAIYELDSAGAIMYETHCEDYDPELMGMETKDQYFSRRVRACQSDVDAKQGAGSGEPWSLVSGRLYTPPEE